MRSAFVEAALYRWFEEHLEGEAKFAKALQLHKSGTRFEDRSEFIIWPRISSVERPALSRRGDELEIYVIEVNVYAKIQPKGDRLLLLSNLVDEVRRLVDSTERAAAQKIQDDKERVIGVLDWGPAQESRLYDQAVSIGAVSIPGVDLCQLRTRCVISPVKPRVR